MVNDGDPRSAAVALSPSAAKTKSWWPLILLLFLTASASYIARVNISTVGALMMRDLGFSQIDMGRLFSAFVLGYALFQVPAGAAADRWGARLVLGWACFGWVLVIAAMAALGWGPLGSATVSAFAILLALRFILGVAESPTFPAAAQGVAQWVPPVQQGSANGVVMAALGGGSAVAPAILSRVMLHWGWRVALLVSALPAIAAGFIWMALRGVGHPSPHPPERHSSSAASSGDLWSRSFVLLTVSYTLEGYVGYIFIFWFYLYLVDVRHFDLLRAGSLSILPGLLSLFSIPLGGFISDRLVASIGAQWGRRAIPMIGFCSSAVFLVLGAGTDSPIAAVVYLALAMATVLSVEGPFWATMIEVAGSRSGTAGGVMNCGSNIGGVISPALTPVLAVYMGWKNALYVAAALAVIGAALWFGISPVVEGDTSADAPPLHV